MSEDLRTREAGVGVMLRVRKRHAFGSNRLLGLVEQLDGIPLCGHQLGGDRVCVQDKDDPIHQVGAAPQLGELPLRSKYPIGIRSSTYSPADYRHAWIALGIVGVLVFVVGFAAGAAWAR